MVLLSLYHLPANFIISYSDIQIALSFKNVQTLKFHGIMVFILVLLKSQFLHFEVVFCLHDAWFLLLLFMIVRYLQRQRLQVHVITQRIFMFDLYFLSLSYVVYNRFDNIEHIWILNRYHFYRYFEFHLYWIEQIYHEFKDLWGRYK